MILVTARIEAHPVGRRALAQALIDWAASVRPVAAIVPGDVRERPGVALALDTAFSIPLEIKIVLAALSISPVPPLLPNKLEKAGGLAPYGLGLMATFALPSIAVVPAAVETLERFAGRPFAIAPAALAGLVLKGVVLPLVAGMAARTARRRLPHVSRSRRRSSRKCCCRWRFSRGSSAAARQSGRGSGTARCSRWWCVPRWAS